MLFSSPLILTLAVVTVTAAPVQHIAAKRASGSAQLSGREPLGQAADSPSSGEPWDPENGQPPDGAKQLLHHEFVKLRDPKSKTGKALPIDYYLPAGSTPSIEDGKKAPASQILGEQSGSEVYSRTIPLKRSTDDTSDEDMEDEQDKADEQDLTGRLEELKGSVGHNPPGWEDVEFLSRYNINPKFSGPYKRSAEGEDEDVEHEAGGHEQTEREAQAVPRKRDEDAVGTGSGGENFKLPLLKRSPSPEWAPDDDCEPWGRPSPFRSGGTKGTKHCEWKKRDAEVAVAADDVRGEEGAGTEEKASPPADQPQGVPALAGSQLDEDSDGAEGDETGVAGTKDEVALRKRSSESEKWDSEVYPELDEEPDDNVDLEFAELVREYEETLAQGPRLAAL